MATVTLNQPTNLKIYGVSSEYSTTYYEFKDGYLNGSSKTDGSGSFDMALYCSFDAPTWSLNSVNQGSNFLEYQGDRYNVISGYTILAYCDKNSTGSLDKYKELNSETKTYTNTRPLTELYKDGFTSAYAFSKNRGYPDLDDLHESSTSRTCYISFSARDNTDTNNVNVGDTYYLHVCSIYVDPASGELSQSIWSNSSGFTIPSTCTVNIDNNGGTVQSGYESTTSYVSTFKDKNRSNKYDVYLTRSGYTTYSSNLYIVPITVNSYDKSTLPYYSKQHYINSSYDYLSNSSSTTLYVKWVRNVSITFNTKFKLYEYGNKAELTFTDVGGIENLEIMNFDNYDLDTNSTDRSGYIFDFWQSSSSGGTVYKSIDEIGNIFGSSTSSLTMHARWIQASKCKITIDYGSEGTVDYQVDVGSKFTFPLKSPSGKFIKHYEDSWRPHYFYSNTYKPESNFNNVKRNYRFKAYYTDISIYLEDYSQQTAISSKFTYNYQIESKVSIDKPKSYIINVPYGKALKEVVGRELTLPKEGYTFKVWKAGIRKQYIRYSYFDIDWNTPINNILDDEEFTGDMRSSYTYLEVSAFYTTAKLRFYENYEDLTIPYTEASINTFQNIDYTPPVPDSRSGYSFLGYSISDSYTYSESLSYYKNSDLYNTSKHIKDSIIRDSIYYGYWAKVYTLAFNPNNGIFTSDGSDSTKTITLIDTFSLSEIDSNILSNISTSRDGYRFLGWFDSNGEDISLDRKYTSDVTFTAKWEELAVYRDRVSIMYKNKAVDAIPYIYKDNKWVKAVPDLYINNQWETTKYDDSTKTTILSKKDYGYDLPTNNLVDGRVFFKFKDKIPDTVTDNNYKSKFSFNVTSDNFGYSLPNTDLREGRLYFILDKRLEIPKSSKKEQEFLYMKDYGDTLPTEELEDGRVFFKI